MSVNALASPVFDVAEVSRALALLHPAGHTFELRVPNARLVRYNGRPDPRTGTAFGFFDSVDSAIATLPAFEAAEWPGLYVTLNPVVPALLARDSNGVMAADRKSYSTSDRDVRGRTAILIDGDPVRPADISATDEEHEAALVRIAEIRWFLSELGWPAPITADSGNGGHLVYRVDLPAEDGGLVKDFLNALADAFDDKSVHVDRTVFNAARIVKVWGTAARKGDSTPERPHRMSRMLDVPAEPGLVTENMLREATAALKAGHEDTPKAATVPPGARAGAFDVRDFIGRHFPHADERTWSSGTRWIVPCPFNSDHAGTSAAILQSSSGVLSFKCQHNGCAGLKWRNLREKFEPKARRPAAAPSSQPASSSADTDSPPDEPRVIHRPLVEVICGIKRRNPFSLGLPHLDAMLGGGLSAGDSLVLGGGPGTIKTTTLATMIRALAGPSTAIFGVFFDEHYERVCRKVAARFGLRYDETEEPSEPATTRLGAELARLDAFFEVVTPETDPTVEAITQECRAATPEGRVTAIFVDHIQRLRSGATGDRDNPSTAVGNVVNALMRATARGAIVVAISEVTKAATLSEVLRANPAGVFADSRAILSRFDVGLATVKLQAPPDSREVLAEVLGTGKNRFGSGQGSYVAALDLETWSITTRDAEAVNAESEQRVTAAKRQKRSAEMRKDDDDVLSYIVARSASQQDGMKRRDVVKGLPASGSGVSENRTDQALIRLRSAGRTEEYQTRAPGVTRGPDATYVRILPEESLA